MDTLHLPYMAVLREIPYRNLVVMQMDKQHVAYDGLMHEVTEEEFFSEQGGIKFSE